MSPEPCCDDPEPVEHTRDGSWYCRNCDEDVDPPAGESVPDLRALLTEWVALDPEVDWCLDPSCTRCAWHGLHSRTVAILKGTS